MNKNKYVIAIDTETSKEVKPFLTSTCDYKMINNVYDMKKSYNTVQQICESSDAVKIFHNSVFDIVALSNIELKVVKPYHDTMLMASLVNENFSRKSLKHLAKRFLKEDTSEAIEIRKEKVKFKKIHGRKPGYDELPRELMTKYAGKDALWTIKLAYLFWKPLKYHMKLYDMEMRLVPHVVEMVKRGVLVDRNFCIREKQMLGQLYKFYTGKIFKDTGKIFNVEAHSDLIKIIKLKGIEIKDRTKKGNISTTKKTLKKLNNDFLNLVIKARSASKQINYYDALLKDYTSTSDPIAHFILYQAGAKTGRFSADLIQTAPKKTELNYLNIPNYFRGGIIARPGYINLYFDYDQIEMRLFAHFANVTSLIDAIKNGFDPHEDTAIKLFGKELYESDKYIYRRRAKIINFGVCYGMGVNALIEALDIPRSKGIRILDRYYRKYPVKQYMHKITKELYKTGHITLDWIGRRYKVPKHLAYKGTNITIQGSAAYIIKKAMIKCGEVIKDFPGVNMLMSIHDELVFEVPYQHYDLKKIALYIKDLMEDHTTFRVPISTSIAWSSTSWYNKKDWEV